MARFWQYRKQEVAFCRKKRQLYFSAVLFNSTRKIPVIFFSEGKESPLKKNRVNWEYHRWHLNISVLFAGRLISSSGVLWHLPCCPVSSPLWSAPCFFLFLFCLPGMGEKKRIVSLRCAISFFSQFQKKEFWFVPPFSWQLQKHECCPHWKQKSICYLWRCKTFENSSQEMKVFFFWQQLFHIYLLTVRLVLGDLTPRHCWCWLGRRNTHVSIHSKKHSIIITRRRIHAPFIVKLNLVDIGHERAQLLEAVLDLPGVRLDSLWWDCEILLLLFRLKRQLFDVFIFILLQSKAFMSVCVPGKRLDSIKCKDVRAIKYPPKALSSTFMEKYSWIKVLLSVLVLFHEPFLVVCSDMDHPSKMASLKSEKRVAQGKGTG